MRFAHAGRCEACVAEDLLFARAINTGRIFFVCAACTAAGAERPTSAMSPWEQSISFLHEELAPIGWSLALEEEVERDFPGQVMKEANPNYERLVAWYPGFRFRAGDMGVEALRSLLKDAEGRTFAFAFKDGVQATAVVISASHVTLNDTVIIRPVDADERLGGWQIGLGELESVSETSG